MEIFQVLLTSAFSLIALFIIAKLIGDKQVSQLSLFDYIIGISIGSIAADMAIELENPEHSLTAMLFYGLSALLVSKLTERSLKLRKIISGRPLILMDNGKIYRENLCKQHLDISDFLMLCRSQGYFDLNSIQTVVMEYNGSLSILPKSTDRPTTPSDLNIAPEQTHMQTAVILDGHINYNNLKLTGKNDIWLKKQLKNLGYKSEKEVYLALCGDNNSFTAFPMNVKNVDSDYSE